MEIANDWLRRLVTHGSFTIGQRILADPSTTEISQVSRSTLVSKDRHSRPGLTSDDSTGVQTPSGALNVPVRQGAPSVSSVHEFGIHDKVEVYTSGNNPRQLSNMRAAMVKVDTQLPTYLASIRQGDGHRYHLGSQDCCDRETHSLETPASPSNLLSKHLEGARLLVIVLAA